MQKTEDIAVSLENEAIIETIIPNREDLQAIDAPLYFRITGDTLFVIDHLSFEICDWRLPTGMLRKLQGFL